MKIVDYITFNRKTKPELLDKLNAVAKREHRPVHNLAEHILLEHLNKRMDELGINSDQSVAQSARAG
jgi:hypothetical protein